MGPEIPQLPREFVAAAQRRRAAEAVAGLAHEGGLPAATTAAICRRARMARTTFYGLFDGLGGCLRHSIAEAHRQVFEPLPVTTGDDWLSTVEAKMAALYGSVDAAPLLAELCLVHSHAVPGPVGRTGFEAAVLELAGQLSQARTEYGLPAIPFVEELLARALASLAASRARQGETGRLVAELPEVVGLVANAYPEYLSRAAIA